VRFEKITNVSKLWTIMCAYLCT